MPPKPGGAKRVGGGAKGGAKGAKKGGAGGAAKGGAAKGGAAKGGAAKGARRAGGPIAVNVRTLHLQNKEGSSMDLIRPISHNQVGNQYVREEYRRNSGHVAGTSTSAMSALGQHGAQAEYGRLRAYSAATKDVGELGKSMTNLFYEEKKIDAGGINKFDGSSLNLSKPSPSHSPARSPARSKFGNMLGAASNLLNPGNMGDKTNLNRSTGCLDLSADDDDDANNLRRSRSNVDVSDRAEEVTSSQGITRQRTFPFNLSPIMSMGSITSSKTKGDQAVDMRKLPAR